MISFNLAVLCKLRGIKHPLPTFKKAGISRNIMHSYLNNRRPTIHVKHIEILCRVLNCTPNDLFTWRPDNETENVSSHALQAIREKPLPDMTAELSKMSIQEIREWMEKREPSKSP